MRISLTALCVLSACITDSYSAEVKAQEATEDNSRESNIYAPSDSDLDETKIQPETLKPENSYSASFSELSFPSATSQTSESKLALPEELPTSSEDLDLEGDFFEGRVHDRTATGVESSLTFENFSASASAVQPDIAVDNPSSSNCESRTIFAREILIERSSVPAIDSRIDEIIRRYEDRILSWEEQNALFNEITFEYIQNGYITSYAECSFQDTSQQQLSIQVIEGFIEEVDIIGINRNKVGEDVDSSGGVFRSDFERCDLVHKEYILSYLHDIPGVIDSSHGNANGPLNIAELDEAIKVLNRDPRFESVTSRIGARSDQDSLQANSRDLNNPYSKGGSILTVEVVEAKGCPYPDDPDSVSLSILFNNYSPPSVGTYRLGVGVAVPGPLDLLDAPNIYDSLALFAQVDPFNLSSIDSSRNLGISYALEIDRQNRKVLSVGYENNRSEVIESSLEAFNIRADAERFNFQYEQEILHSPIQDLSLSLGLSIEDSQTFIFEEIPLQLSLGPDEQGTSRSSILTFGQRYSRRGRGNQVFLSSNFNLGTKLFNATQNSDGIPDGQFLSWNLQFLGIQRLSSNHRLVISSDLQLTTDSLLPINQFTIGGAQSVRGYNQNAFAGDNGFRISIEDYIAIGRDRNRSQSLFLIPFIDAGTIWNNSKNPNTFSNQDLLLSTGLGLEWFPDSNLRLRVDYGVPLVNSLDSGSSLQESGFTFQLSYDLDVF